MSTHVSDIKDCFTVKRCVFVLASMQDISLEKVHVILQRKDGLGTTKTKKTDCLFLYCPEAGILLFTMYITDECFLCFVQFFFSFKVPSVDVNFLFSTYYTFYQCS